MELKMYDFCGNFDFSNYHSKTDFEGRILTKEGDPYFKGILHYVNEDYTIAICGYSGYYKNPEVYNLGVLAFPNNSEVILPNVGIQKPVFGIGNVKYEMLTISSPYGNSSSQCNEWLYVCEHKYSDDTLEKEKNKDIYFYLHQYKKLIDTKEYKSLNRKLEKYLEYYGINDFLKYFSDEVVQREF